MKSHSFDAFQGMEKKIRDQVGVQDFVLLADYTNEDAFIGNLRKRAEADSIYTYIGQVLIAVNPYKQLPIYTEDVMQEYRKKHFFQAPPHIFAVCDKAYRSLTEENEPQCILISGESGSGKTESSKKVLEFIAAASGHLATADSIRDKLLQSNPVLEAFGNAKTTRNENSSRFGKYMDVQFSSMGLPEGGDIINYLLEKSRVVNQGKGERNFHIFYQLLAGADEDLLQSLHLKRNLDSFYYISNGSQAVDNKIPDQENFREVCKAMSVIGIDTQEQRQIFDIIASILHIGNIGFTSEDGAAKVSKPDSVQAVSKLLGIPVDVLTMALTHRTIETREGTITSPLERDHAIYARDAVAKAVYSRLFTSLVQRLNKSLRAVNGTTDRVIGILDIYGFEVMDKNNFEQFCINYCNEKLQQLFIELTLKSEQEEYRREGIEWENVAYFDNRIICQMIEERHAGIISIMDEECLRPGEATDLTLLAKMNQNLQRHAHYVCHVHSSTAVQKTMGRDEFRLVHYAGHVTYNVNGFLDKNNDLLFRDLKEALIKSTNQMVTQFFYDAEVVGKKRPETVATQFKNSLNNLMNILVSKQPSYIRCIKPNAEQLPGRFDDELVRHQVRYLNLMENLRVRRSGFAYRKEYEPFLKRYKCLAKETWPHFKGTEARDGVQLIAKALGYKEDDYKMGKTKIFIRHPMTIFATEDAFQEKKNYLASLIQAQWKGRQQRLKYLALRELVIRLQTYVRRYQAIQRLERRKEAVVKIRAFIKGFITRNDAPNGLNESFIANVKKMWLLRLAKNLPSNLLDNAWPSCPASCAEASLWLHRYHRNHLARTYRRNLTMDQKNQLELKVLAEKVFKGKKKSYPESLPNPFVTERITGDQRMPIRTFMSNNFKADESLKYSTNVTKYDRHGYKPRERLILLSNQAMYVIDSKSMKQKHRLPLDNIDFCVTNEADELLLTRIPVDFKKDKGDLIMAVPELIEFCVWVMTITNRLQVTILNSDTIQHAMLNNKTGTIELREGQRDTITSDRKSGHLIVTHPSTIQT